jgi:tRNA uridine 5-carboxymethylaminomethyl modification enzyme
MNEFEVIVVGGGHAGCEAAAASARLGVKTALLTIRKDRIAEMSCNPAIGGLAKGQIVREVDAMGGLMAEVADIAGIQFRILNASKGPAVRAPRAQEDKVLYRETMQNFLENTENLTIVEAEAKALILDGNRAVGVQTDSGELKAGAVIITGGTFLNGIIHTGEVTKSAGRMGEKASIGLSENMQTHGLRMLRLKTGTPPRIKAETIDYSKFEKQFGDSLPTPFSYLNRTVEVEQIQCYIGYTNQSVHETINDSIHRSPLFSGTIKGIGPRYCPSIEDKVVKFPEKERHQIFLEPETKKGKSIYVNGVSSSLPEDVQKKFIACIPGMEKAVFIRPGYAIEYDSIDPRQLKITMETKDIENLYCCGQINGTSGYEEAAGQGLVAGANAALKIKGKEPLIMEREDSYIGVMINDLITHGADEPYRMFTSRAENRLLLRSDNADKRLTSLAREKGLISDHRWQVFNEKQDRINLALKAISNHRVKTKEEAEDLGINLKGGLKNATSLKELLRRPEVWVKDFAANLPDLATLTSEEIIFLETDIKYEGYISRSAEYSKRIESQKNKKIPIEFEYDSVPGLSLEMRDRLKRVRPETVGQAAQIPGITPAATAAVAIMLARLEKRKES